MATRNAIRNNAALLGGNRLDSQVRFHEPAYDSQSSSEEEDEQDTLRREGTDPGRVRSERGEKRKTQTEDEIAKEYGKEKAQRRTRPKLETSQLTGAAGLIRIPHEFGKSTSLRYRAKKGQKDVASIAAFGRSLMNAYRSFCYSVCPSMAFEDVLLKIEQLGSKRDVRAYLQQMREDARNQHVERIFGKEKAQKMLAELEMGLKQQRLGFETLLDEEASRPGHIDPRLPEPIDSDFAMEAQVAPTPGRPSDDTITNINEAEAEDNEFEPSEDNTQLQSPMAKTGQGEANEKDLEANDDNVPPKLPEGRDILTSQLHLQTCSSPRRDESLLRSDEANLGHDEYTCDEQVRSDADQENPAINLFQLAQTQETCTQSPDVSSHANEVATTVPTLTAGSQLDSPSQGEEVFGHDEFKCGEQVQTDADEESPAVNNLRLRQTQQTSTRSPGVSSHTSEVQTIVPTLTAGSQWDSPTQSYDDINEN